MRVSPVQFMFAIVPIAFIYIDTAFKSDSSVDDDNFAMISKICLSKKCKGNRHKTMHGDASLTQPSNHFSIFCRSEIIDYDSYFNSFLYLSHQDIDYFFSYIIV